jgi:hypothetical protein
LAEEKAINMTGERRPGPARGKRSNGGTLALWDALPSVSVGKFAGDTWKDMTDDWIPVRSYSSYRGKARIVLRDPCCTLDGAFVFFLLPCSSLRV